MMAWVADVLRILGQHPLKMAVLEWTDPGPSVCLIRKRIEEGFRRILTKSPLLSAPGAHAAVTGEPSKVVQDKDH